MLIRKAEKSDLADIMKIYRYAQDFMIKSGNPNQWAHVYPSEELVKSDIESGVCNVICEGEKVHGVFVLKCGDDPTYKRIDDGQWLNNEPYVAIHRVAGDGEVHGLFRCASDYAKSCSDNVRIDTHNDNLTMQKLIMKNGYVKCGTIYVADGSPRIAYHKNVYALRI